MLAAASKAVIFGFHVRPEPAGAQARRARGRRDPHVRHRLRVARRRDVADARAAAAEGDREAARQRAGARSCSTFRRSARSPAARSRKARSPAPRARACCATASWSTRASSRRCAASRTTCARSTAPLECGIGIENFNDVKVGESDRGVRDRGDARYAVATLRRPRRGERCDRGRAHRARAARGRDDQGAAARRALGEGPHPAALQRRRSPRSRTRTSGTRCASAA